MNAWPAHAPPALVAWAVWALNGKVGKRPESAPASIPKTWPWAYQFTAYCLWVRRGKAGPRPKVLPASLPAWAPQLAARVIHNLPAVPVPTSGPPLVPAGRSRTPSKGRNGMYFYNEPEKALGVAGRLGLWVGLLTHEGEHLTPAQSPPGLREQLQAEGCVVVATGYVDPAGDFEAQAVAIAEASAGFDEYMADVEGGWGYGDGDTAFFRSDLFCPLLRKHTAIPVSISTMWGEAVHLRPWLDIGLEVVRPQCYVNEHPHMTPASALAHLEGMQHDLPGGLRPDQVEPTYGKYGNFQGVSLDEYKALHLSARLGGVQACSVWAAEFLSPAEAEQLAAL